MTQQQSTNPAQLYESYFVPGIHARWTPIFLDYARPSAGERVLDVACGTGLIARKVAPLVGQEGSVAGIDISADMLAVARELPKPSGAGIEWLQGEATSLPDDRFDLVTCQQGLQFFPDRAAAVREMRRVTAEGGRTVLSVWEGLHRHPLYEALCVAEARHLNTPVEEVATPFTMGDEDELRALLASAGFREVEIAQESYGVGFPAPERFVTLTLYAAASLLPQFGELDEEGRHELVQTVSREVEPTLRQYTDGDTVSFPMHAHIAVARA